MEAALGLLELPVVPIVVGCILIALAYYFFASFVRPAGVLGAALDGVIERVEAARLKGERNLTSCFAADPPLAAIWQEYRETLHTQKAIDPTTGEMVETAIRSTVPAELFFSSHNVVDGRVHAEFFKHLPGIFTGIGIIGTFLGLLKGLWVFEISEDAGVVRTSLASLLHGVSEAFAVSAFAILFAMVATFVEKYRLNQLYGQVARMVQAIDATYEAGAGEEYLARLVSSSEESASQTRILKDALVSDLREILTDLAERQIAATTQRSSELGSSIASALTQALKDPLDQIAGAVGQVSRDQGSAVTSLLTDVLASFSEKLESMFGEQLSGIGEMQQRTIESMQTAVARLQDLTTNAEAAGTRATDAMSAKMVEVMTAAEARQAAMGEELRATLAEMRANAGLMQSETQARMQEMLGELSLRLGEALERIDRQAAERAERQTLDEERRATASAGQITRIGSSVDDLTANVEAMLRSVGEMVIRIEATTRDAFVRLNGGADTLLTAAGRFEASGHAAAESFTKVASVTTNLSEAAGSVAGAARSLDGVVSDHRSSRDAVAAMLDGVRETVDRARREAALTGDVLERIEGAAQKLAVAQQTADGFLEDVTDVIAEAHQKFAEGMRTTVLTANREFHKELSTATGLLKDAIQELELALPTARVGA